MPVSGAAAFVSLVADALLIVGLGGFDAVVEGP
jgi:hypothetical protein